MSMSWASWVTVNPNTVAVLLAVLVLAVIILVVLTVRCHYKLVHATSQHFDTSAWKYGSVMDWGLGGGSPVTPAQASVYMPQLGGVRSELSRMMMPKYRGHPRGAPRYGHYREHLATDPTVAGTSCSSTWNPSAIAEAQGLAEASSLAVDPEDDTAMLQAAINTSRDANSAAYSMSDTQLAGLMGGGNLP